MKRTTRILLITFVFAGLPLSAIGSPDSGQGGIKQATYSRATEQEMQIKQRSCLSGSYFGPVAPQQDVQYRNCEGKVLYGRIDAAGYGKLVDENGNIVMVVPTLRSN